MLNITSYSDEELSLLMLNTEDCYNFALRCNNDTELFDYVNERYVFTDLQWAVLCEDVSDL
ncbi:MAG: hypothetical protein DRP45_10215 [Candidatus Zixiibacteriota bacterium]|nr:MAG: hypothetical protein DRP45_10215 [candidate division Zixibacteria bacterium]